MQPLSKRFKGIALLWRRHLGWVARVGFVGATFLFLIKTLLANWQDVRSLELQNQAWLYGSMALGMALLTQFCNSLIWGSLLKDLQHPVPKRWSVITVLRYNPAKYIPGNIWHFYGRVMAAQQRGLNLATVTLSVLLEPLFIIAGAFGIALFNPSYLNVKGLGFLLILGVIHPRVLNQLWCWLRQWQQKEDGTVRMQHYPLRTLTVSTVFMGLRSLTFLCVVLLFTPISWDVLRPLVSGFSLAWALSLVTPAPAGLGVFEASAVTTLNGYFSSAVLLGAVAIYRLINICAELLGASAAYSVSDAHDQEAI